MDMKKKDKLPSVSILSTHTHTRTRSMTKNVVELLLSLYHPCMRVGVRACVYVCVRPSFWPWTHLTTWQQHVRS